MSSSDKSSGKSPSKSQHSFVIFMSDFQISFEQLPVLLISFKWVTALMTDAGSLTLMESLSANTSSYMSPVPSSTPLLQAGTQSTSQSLMVHSWTDGRLSLSHLSSWRTIWLALYHLTKHHMLAAQMGSWHGGNEELWLRLFPGPALAIDNKMACQGQLEILVLDFTINRFATTPDPWVLHLDIKSWSPWKQSPCNAMIFLIFRKHSFLQCTKHESFQVLGTTSLNNSNTTLALLHTIAANVEKYLWNWS